MSGNKLDKCPKCASKITNETECEKCGIVFEKYLKTEVRNKGSVKQVKTSPEDSPYRSALILTGIVIISIVAAFIYLGEGKHFFSKPGKTVNAQVPSDASNNRLTGYKKPDPLSMAKNEPSAGREPSGDPIQNALKATVTVRTPWGATGSGFFINEHSVITNRHVIKLDDASFEAFKSRVEKNRKMINVEIDKINEWKKKMEDIPEGADRTQWEIFIRDREQEVNRVLPLQKQNEEELSSLIYQRSSQNIKIVMSDGKEYTVDRVIPSPDHDLALLKVDSVYARALERSTKERLKQGQAVYAVGSPLGLDNTVTSGIFSAYRKIAGHSETYLQVDAAINPGNSGGPLIDKEGYVLGVNTMGARQARGIGFAIPIEVVFEAFSDSL
jgi:S1-C subfamily serine protease